MADQFDIVDIVFNAVESANTGFISYKSNSVTGEVSNHITIAIPPLKHQDYVNKAPFLNVNIFIKKHSNGMPDYQLIKSTTKSVEKALKGNIVIPDGMYLRTRIIWSDSLGEAKEGFDCQNIRLEVITELN